jgi:hypothetical protein
MNDRIARRRAPAWDHLERRQVAAVVGLAPAAVAILNSPLVAAASTAATVYQVGQLAYTGHTTFGLGAVRVDQPYSLRGHLGKHPGPHRQPPGPPLAAPLGVRLQVPPLLARLWHEADRAQRSEGAYSPRQVAGSRHSHGGHTPG